MLVEDVTQRSDLHPLSWESFTVENSVLNYFMDARSYTYESRCLLKISRLESRNIFERNAISAYVIYAGFD